MSALGRTENARPQFCIARGCRLCEDGGLSREQSPTPTLRSWDVVIGRLDGSGSKIGPGSDSHPCPSGRQVGIGVAAVGLDRACRGVLEQIFRESHEFYSYGFFPKAAAALKSLPKLGACLVVVELSLGKECGVEFTRQLLARMPDVGVLLITANTEPALQGRIAASGVADSLTKPVSRRRFRYRLSTVVSRSVLGRPPQSAYVGVASQAIAEPQGSLEHPLRAVEKRALGFVAQGLQNKEIICPQM